MTALKGVAQCDTNSICTKKSVLNYYFNQDVKAGYFARDLKLKDSINVAQKEVITYKDSVLRGQSENYAICEMQNEICNLELNSNKSNIKKLQNKVTLFKITTLVTIISTLYFILH